MLAWCDTETTGLNVKSDHLLELAIVLTDDDLNVIASRAWIASCWTPPTAWAPEVMEMHTKNGLIADIWARGVDKVIIAQEAVEWLDSVNRGGKGKPPLCGSTIGFDRKFLEWHLPVVESWFNYRSVDVSSLKELCRRWLPRELHYPSVAAKPHRAALDVLESIRELAYYRAILFAPANPTLDCAFPVLKAPTP